MANRRQVLMGFAGVGGTLVLPGIISSTAMNPAEATELAENKIVTIEQMAAMNFEPWTSNVKDCPLPTNRQWNAMANPDLVSLRMAWHAVHQPKDVLVVRIGEMWAEEGGPDVFNEMITNMQQAAAMFRGFADLLECAENRLLCALASVDIADDTEGGAS